MGNNTFPILKNHRKVLLEQENAYKAGSIPSGQAADSYLSRKITKRLENAGGQDWQVEDVVEDLGIQDILSDLPSSVKIILVGLYTWLVSFSRSNIILVKQFSLERKVPSDRSKLLP